MNLRRVLLLSLTLDVQLIGLYGRRFDVKGFPVREDRLGKLRGPSTINHRNLY